MYTRYNPSENNERMATVRTDWNPIARERTWEGRVLNVRGRYVANIHGWPRKMRRWDFRTWRLGRKYKDRTTWK